MEHYQCSYCQNAIDSCRIKCNGCRPDVDIELCLQCFACGVEIGEHKKEHDYRVLFTGNGNFDVLGQPGLWLYEEEVLLLEAVEQFGYGNWESVSNYVKTKSPEECVQHFNSYYVEGTIGQVTLPKSRIDKVNDHAETSEVLLSPTQGTSKPRPPVHLSLKEQRLLGYKPLRDDFEHEFDSGAESSASGVYLSHDHDKLDIAVRLAQIDSFRLRIKERYFRKRIAREHGVIQKAATLLRGKKMTATIVRKLKNKKNLKKSLVNISDMQTRLRAFARFHTMVEHEQLCINLQTIKRLRLRIKELTLLKKAGMTKLVGKFRRDSVINTKTAVNGFNKKKRRRKKRGGTYNSWR